MAKRFMNATLLLILCSSPFATADENAARNATPSQLKPLFADDFQRDSRSDYEVMGDVSWDKGRLSLAPDSSIKKKVDSGSWADVKLVIESGKLEKDGDRAVTVLQFELDGATDCQIVWMASKRDGKTVRRVRIYDTVKTLFATKRELIRERLLTPEIPDGDWSVTYRHGLLTVSSSQAPFITGYIENGSATVAGVLLRAVYRPTQVRTVKVAGVEPPPALSPEELKELSTAGQLNSQAIRLYRQGKAARALVPARQAAEIRKRLQGQGHPDYSVSLNNLAEFYRVLGDYPKAEPLFVQARKIDKKVLGEEHPRYATCLNNLANLYEAMGDYAKAEPLHVQAMEIRKRVLGEEHPRYSVSLNNLAVLYQAMGDYGKAEPLQVQARDIRKRVVGEEHPSYATSLNNLANLYHAMGDYAKAEPLYLQALDIIKRVVGEGHPRYATSLNNLAVLYHSMGNYTKAESLAMQARDTIKKVQGEEHPDYARSLNHLAALYQAMGDYAKAESLYVQARDIRKKVFGGQHPVYAGSLNNLAELYRAMGDYARAEPLYVQALDIIKKVLGEGHPSYAISLNNLAVLYQTMGDYAKAEPLYVQALDIKRRVLGKGHPDYALSLNNLAELYRAMGEYAKAEPLYVQALNITEDVRGKEHPDYATSLNNLAELYRSMGEYAKAEPRFVHARDIIKNVLGEEHPHYALSLANLAALYESTGDYAKAELLLVESVNVEFKLATQVLTSKSEAQALNYLAANSPNVGGLLSVALHLDEPRHDAYELVWRGRRLLHRVTAQRNRQLYLVEREASPETKQHFRDYQLARRRIGQLILAAAEISPQVARKRKDELAKLSDQKESLERRLVADLPEFARVVNEQRSRPTDLLKHLPNRAVFVELVRYTRVDQDPNVPGRKGRSLTPSYAAFVVHPNQPIRRVELGPANPIDEAADAWRAAISRGESTPAATQALSKLVWQPLAKAFPAGVKSLYLCPDSSLAIIPWAALPTGKGGRVVLEDYAVAVVPHGHFVLRQLTAKTEASQDADRMLLVGDVSYGSRPARPTFEEIQLASRTRHRDAVVGGKRVEWPALPAGKQETADVAHLAGDCDTTQLAADQATTDGVLRELPKSQYAHFATHGFFADKKFRSYLQVIEDNFERDRGFDSVGSRGTFAGRNPLVLSGLVFAGANLPREKDEYGIPTDDGGILAAEAIASLPLYDLKLAVLSACETGLGDVAGGEGVYGLQRAFHTAGTQNVIASLWKVNDDATASLMRLFYYKLWKENKPPLEALREAQLYV